MIKVDISNVWGRIALSDLLALEKELFAAHNQAAGNTEEHPEVPEWIELPGKIRQEEIQRISDAAARIRENSDVFMVVGTGGNLSARAAIELIQGKNRNLGKGKGDPMILFAGDTYSVQSWNQLMELLEGKDFSLALISKSGTTMESALASRSLRWMLERKYGTDEAKKRIFAVTDPVEGALRQMANEEGWESFIIPRGATGYYSVLSSAGLLPMAVAGLDIREVIRGAKECQAAYSIRSFDNPVWLYTAVRSLMLRRDKAVELLSCFAPDFGSFGFWWQQIFARSDGKNGTGLFPVSLEYPADLHALGQMIQQGQRNLFETLLRFDTPEQKMEILSDWRDADGLNYLEGKNLGEIEDAAHLAVLDAHVDGGVPVLTMDAGKICEATVGDLFYFFQLCSTISACFLGVDPYLTPGFSTYSDNLNTLLGKPRPKL